MITESGLTGQLVLISSAIVIGAALFVWHEAAYWWKMQSQEDADGQHDGL